MFIASHRLFRPGGEIDVIAVKAKDPEHVEGHVQYLVYLSIKLVRPAENMCIILREPPDPHEAVEGSCHLVTVDSAKLAPS